MLNGYETLDLFKEVEDEDLDALKITNTEHRIKLLTAAELLQYDDDDTVVADDIMQTEETQTEPDYEKRNELLSTEVLAQLTSSPRDSGCYASSENLLTRESPRSGQSAKKDDQEEFWQDGQLINESPDQVPNQSDQSFDSVSVQVTTSREVLESPTRCGYVNVEIKKNHDYVNIEVFSQCSDENSNGEGSKVNVTVGKNETNSRPEICIKNGHHVETVSQKDEEVIPSTAGSVSESRQNGLQSPNNCTNGEPTSRGEEVAPSPSFHELVNLYEKSASELSPRTGRKAATMGGRGSPKAMPKHPKTFPRNNNVGENTNTDDNHNGMLQQTKSEDAMHQSPVLSRTTNITENGDCDSSKKAVKVKPPPVAAKPKPKHKQSPSVSSKMDHSSSTSSSRTNQCIVLDSPPISHRLPRPQAMPLPTLVDRKLDDDQIDLTSEPYSDQMGFCGIPSALIQRYAEELKSPLQDVANTMETVRMTHLKNHGRLGISSVSLTEISNSNSIVTAKDTTLKSWLTSQGLPMYTEPLLGKGWSTVVSLCDMLEDDMRECGMNDPRHIRRLLAAIETLKLQQISQ
uniref:SAM and SH3 domain-containing protein 1-like n=1 Tax=Saccoglossus kowalevskii TaxID=10224 RepID=A0ABM0LVS4_SACKO|nr:PREDICTED: SAM and SH3 domain-containing protein 1-like [Saccoglossus kowalevskii]